MIKNDRNIKTLFGLKVDCIQMDQVVERIKEWIASGKKGYIVTPNSEIVMEAQKDEEFRSILNKAEMRIPDGAGLVWAVNRTFNPKVKCVRVTGVDVMLKVCMHANKQTSKQAWRVFLLGGQDQVAKKAAEKLRLKYPNLKIKGSMGPKNVNRASSQENDKTIKEINDFKPDLLFVGFGHNKQEKWIAKNLARLNIKVAMGVGGSFNYLIKPWLRAPKLIQVAGFEWLWRLILQPWRIKRQLKLLKFTWLVYLS